MKAQNGDRIVVEARTIGQASREGTISEVLSGGASEHYRVRWDTGEETILFPQSDCVITPSGADEAHESNEVDLRRPEVRHPSIDMSMTMDEDEDHTEARVTIHLRDYDLTGFGDAWRNPHDPTMPVVGEELAAARAMADLAHQLHDLATYQIEKVEGRPVLIDL